MSLGVLALPVPSPNAGFSASEPLFVEEITMVGDAAYATGGTLGLQAAYQALGTMQSGRTIAAVLPVDTYGYSIAWDSTLSKVKVYWPNGTGVPGVEVPAATNLSAVTFKLLIVSR
jgi:hypothetical protein